LEADEVGSKTFNLGLFLAACAATLLAMGSPQAAAANPTARAEELVRTPEGQAALARYGLTPERFSEMLERLTPAQRARVERLLRQADPRSRLETRLIASGYTPAEARERLAALSDDEIAALADHPDAMTAGTSDGVIVGFAALLLVIVFLVIYFLFIEDDLAPPEK
jgi:hypothetical protein